MSILKYWEPKVRFVTEMSTEGFPEDTVYTTKYPWYHWYLSVWTGPNLGLEITLQDLKDGFRVGFTSNRHSDERGRFIISLFPLDFGIYYYTEKEMIEYGMTFVK